MIHADHLGGGARAPGSRATLNVVVVVKTNQGGAWIVPQVEELRTRGHRVTVVLPRGSGRLRRELDARGIGVVDSSFDFCFRPGLNTLLGLRRFRRQLMALEADVVLYHLYASALAVRLALVGSAIPGVHMVAGPLYLDSALIRAFERWLVRLDRVLVCGSEHTLRRYVALSGRLPRTVVLPYGVDTSRFQPPSDSERASARRSLGIEESAFVVVLVAYVYAPKRLVHHGKGIKGHEDVLGAWRAFAADAESARLLLVGSGFDEAGERHRQALMAERVSRVTWIDTVDDVRLPYAAADVSVSPSLSENHGAALEASALGVPCIVSDAGGLPETVTTASGWVVPAGDPAALLAALRQAQSEARSGSLSNRSEAARRHVVARFDAADAARHLGDVVEEAAAQTSEPAVLVVSEVRLARSSTGEWVAPDGVNGDAQWDRYRASLGPVALAARGSSRACAEGDALRTTAVAPLIDFTGVLGLGRHLLAVLRDTRAAVRGRQLVIVRVPGPLGTIASLWARTLGIPYAAEMVGDPRDVIESGAVSGLGSRVARVSQGVTRLVVRHAVAVRYVTGFALQRRYPVKCGRLSFAIPNVRLRDDDYVPRPREALAPGSMRALAIGSQENLYKGHDTLIHATRRLRDAGFDAHLELVGEGRAQPQLRALSEKLGLGDAVTFLGRLDRVEIRAACDRADVLVHPSRTEGMPRVVLEAMARALPVVATTVGGVPEVVPRELLVDPDDDAGLARVIAGLVQDPSAYTAASSGAWHTAQSFRDRVLDARFDQWLEVLGAYVK